MAEWLGTCIRCNKRAVTGPVLESDPNGDRPLAIICYKCAYHDFKSRISENPRKGDPNPVDIDFSLQDEDLDQPKSDLF